jgi:uncharacterized membrane protein
MEAIIILLLLAILAVPIILLVWFKVSTSSLIREVINKVNSLNIKVDQLQKIPPTTVEAEEEDNVNINESLFTLMETIPEEKKVEEEEQIVEIEEVQEEVVALKVELEKVEEPIKEIPQQAAFVKPPKKKRDIEKFIGENLINKIGIGVLVLGIAYFVNYAIDNNWINEVGRVAIGILSGGLLTFLAHKIRKTYKAFSSVLVGGAMAVFYYTISIGFHEYDLFSQHVAFGLMALITGFSVLLSISYDRKELAILALIGAFSTPVMVSNGGGNYQILFGYLTIVNIGMLVLAYFKKWNVVNILSFAFTAMLYAGWFGAKVVGVINPPYQGAFIFASIFYVLFFFMHIVNNVKEKRKFKGFEFGLMLSTTALFYAAGMVILNLSGNQQLQGLFTLVLAVFNLLFAYPLYKRNSVDKSLIYLLLGTVLTFVSLAAPVQLSGNYITLFWTAEMLLLLWLGQKSGIKFMKFSSLTIFGLMLISLVMDWQQIYFDYGTSTLPIILNKGFLTTMFSVAGIAAYIRLLNNENEINLLPGIKVEGLKNIAKMIFTGLVYFIGAIEIGFQLGDRIQAPALTTISVLAYTYLFHLALSYYAKATLNKSLTKGLLIVSAILLFIYPMFNGLEQHVRDAVLMGELNSVALITQYLNLGLVLCIAVQLVKNVKALYGLRTDIGKVTLWSLSFIGLIVASMHLNHQMMLLFFDFQNPNMAIVDQQTLKIGFPIVWGLSSFALMLLGMKYKFRTLRVISLSIFTVILFKLFLFDIKGASEAGKIVAFILLGVLLLVISFMYQKLKNLILDNNAENN